jgi:hypothetical protein
LCASNNPLMCLSCAFHMLFMCIHVKAHERHQKRDTKGTQRHTKGT